MGQVFHQNHDELHGFTVVIRTKGTATFIGRWDREDGGMIFLKDAAIHNDGDEGKTTDEFVKHAAIWGVTAAHPYAAVERAHVASVRKLGEIASEVRGW